MDQIKPFIFLTVVDLGSKLKQQQQQQQLLFGIALSSEMFVQIHIRDTSMQKTSNIAFIVILVIES